MTFTRRFISFIFLIVSLPGMGQSAGENFTALSLDGAGSFQSFPSNWTLNGEVSMNPVKASSVTVKTGTGVLLGKPGASLATSQLFKDLRLKLEFMTSPGASGALVLPGGKRLVLADSWHQSGTSEKTCGYIGQFPIQNAGKAPGLWQTLELAYDAAADGKTAFARIATVRLNDIVIQENVYLPQQKAAVAVPLSFEVSAGAIAFRSIGYQQLSDSKPVVLSKLSYQLYTDAWDSKSLVKLDHQKETTRLTQEVGGGMREFHLIYEGDINVSEAGKYFFTTWYTGPACALDIDGKNVVASEGSSSEEGHRGAVELSKGTHRFKLRYSKYPWRRPALGLRVEKSGIRAYDLHALSSLPEPDPEPFIRVEPDSRPEMIRSFILLEGEQTKRTRCLSVGSPVGRHYTMDLNTGALLQVWKGEFADVTDMWHERGEPQLLAATGSKVLVSPKSSLAFLTDINAGWPDSSGVSFQGYHLDQQGFPVVKYKLAATEISDHLVAGGDGMERRVQLINPQAGTKLYILMAVGDKVVRLDKGLYQVDNRYYLKLDKRAEVVERVKDGKQELVLPVTDSGSYSLFW